MFLQIHFLTSYHASLLNRDDAGLAKRVVFGGVPRLRVSSQCQKRHWREWMTSRTDLPAGTRSRLVFDRILRAELEQEGMAPDLATALVTRLADEVMQVSDKRTKGGNGALDKDAVVRGVLGLSQAVLLGRPEVDYLKRIVKEAAKAGDTDAGLRYISETVSKDKKNVAAMRKQTGLDRAGAGFEGAMFGRFATSDLLARVDAPVHVAHAFTTHRLETEVDFFTVVDDLVSDDETGTAHLNDVELGAGIFYGYVAVDIPLLVSNLTGCHAALWRKENPDASRALLSLLIRAAAEVSPGAKLGATAPHARAECVLLEVGTEQPRSLANAFLEPVRMGGHTSTNPMAESVAAMGRYAQDLDRMYGSEVERFVASLHTWPDRVGTCGSFADTSKAALDAILGASR